MVKRDVENTTKPQRTLIENLFLILCLFYLQISLYFFCIMKGLGLIRAGNLCTSEFVINLIIF